MFEELLNGLQPDLMPNMGSRGEAMPMPRQSPMPSPSFPSGAPGGGAQAPSESGMGGKEKFEKMLRAAIPLLAMALGSRGDGAGVAGFAQGWGQGEQDRLSNLDRIAQHRERIDARKADEADRAQQRARQARMDYERAEQLQRELSAKAETQRLAEEEQKRTIVGQTLKPYLEDPAFIEKINDPNYDENGAGIVVPGVGDITLKDAFDLIYFGKGPDGKYRTSAPEEDPLVTLREEQGDGSVTEELIPRSDRVKRGRVTVSRPTPKAKPAPKTQDHEVITETTRDANDNPVERKYRVYLKPDGSVDRKVQISGPPETGPADRPSGAPRKAGRFEIIEEP